MNRHDRRAARKSHGHESIIIPKEATPRCRRLVAQLLSALGMFRAPGDTEDRCAALAICLFSEVANIGDPQLREEFAASLTPAAKELIAATVSANAENAA